MNAPTAESRYGAESASNFGNQIAEKDDDRKKSRLRQSSIAAPSASGPRQSNRRQSSTSGTFNETVAEKEKVENAPRIVAKKS